MNHRQRIARGAHSLHANMRGIGQVTLPDVNVVYSMDPAEKWAIGTTLGLAIAGGIWGGNMLVKRFG